MAAFGQALVLRAGIALPRDHVVRGEFASNVDARPGFEVIRSMSAYARFPWVFAGASAISSDLAQLPLILFRGEGEQAQRIDEHPVLVLLDQPNERETGRAWRQQSVFDRVLEGNNYTLQLNAAGQPSNGTDRPNVLLRMHPERISIRPDIMGLPLVYRFDANGQKRDYPWKAVMHVRGASWEDGDEGLFGQGAIRALNDYLNADFTSWKRQAQQAKTGRPDMVISPDSKDGPSMEWQRKQIKEVRDAIGKLFSEAEGGAAVLPSGIQIDQLSWSSKDVEFVEQSRIVRDAILGSLGVPPVRVGLPSANFATAREQERAYWHDTIGGFAVEFDDVYTRLARCWDPKFRIVHDFSGVQALQFDRTERVKRVETLWLLGVPLANALAAEGLEDIDLGSAASTPTPTPEPADDTDTDEDADRSFDEWFGAVTKQQDNGNSPTAALEPFTVPVTEEARTTEWRSFASELHDPGERTFRIVFQRYQREAAERYAKRLKEVLGELLGELLDQSVGDVVTRQQISSTDISAILAAAEEDAALINALGPDTTKRIRLAFGRAARQIGVELTFDPTINPVSTFLKKLSPLVNDVTRVAVEEVILGGVDAGLSIAQMQGEIQQAAAFSPTRALRVARTETTRAVNAGATQAYAAAAEAGVKLKKQWLTARDDEVRESHMDMDGQERSIGEEFDSPDGGSAQHPGDFGVAEEDINCRCTSLPVVTT